MLPRRTDQFQGQLLSPFVLFVSGLLLGWWCVGLGVPSVHGASIGPSTYLDDLIQQARAARLWERREWHLLMHYQPGRLGGFKSQQDDPGFFLSQAGKEDPQGELEATLAAFFSEELVGRSKQPAQCAFVARYTWLHEQLGIDDSRLVPLTCERFQNWLKEFSADGLSLIFPAGFMNNPSSMFGHTFLRIDQRGQTDSTRILAYTINYAAELPPDVGPEYAIKGIFGGYQGFFTTIPYYVKVQEYRDLENRDIWEYRLNLTDAQVRRILMHAWELGNAWFDYYFFDENCSYHILSLLNVAEPSFDLTQGFDYYTLPSDTVRALMNKPGLVGRVTYRPSRRTLVQRKRARLSAEEDHWLLTAIRQPAGLADSPFQALPVPRQALILDAASDYLLMRAGGDSGDEDGFRTRNRQVLSLRSQLRVLSEPIDIKPFTQRPDIGHGTSRVTVGSGWRNNDLYQEVTFRGAYHDLLDPDPGYTPDAQIETVALSLRYYHRREQARIERFTLLNMVSLSPMDRLFRAPSWRLNLGMNSIRHGGCQLCSNGVASGSIGGAIESAIFHREVWFAFADVEGNYSRAYAEQHRVGGGGTIGLLANLTERWKLLASTSYLRYALGEQTDDWRWSIGQRYTLSQNLAVRMEYTHRDQDNDVVLSLHAYF